MVEGVEVSTDHLVGGERLASSDRFSDASPIDEQVIARVARGDADSVDLAVAAADGASDAWGRTPPKERAAVLHRIADGIEARTDELSVVETRDNGSLLRSHRRSVMPRVARNFRFFADKLLELEQEGDTSFNGNRERVTNRNSELAGPGRRRRRQGDCRRVPAGVDGRPRDLLPSLCVVYRDQRCGLPNVPNGLCIRSGPALRFRP